MGLLRRLEEKEGETMLSSHMHGEGSGQVGVGHSRDEFWTC